MFTSNLRLSILGCCAVALVASGGPLLAQQVGNPEFNFGKDASSDLIQSWAIAIPPDGEHLPEGEATANEGAEVFAQHCATCHGEDLQGVEGTGGVALIGGRGSLDSGSPKKTVESYWPYATTLFDYTRRSMPFTNPGSLSNQQVYAVTAYILFRSDIIGKDEPMNAKTLPEVKMPNRDGFYTKENWVDVINYR